MNEFKRGDVIVQIGEPFKWLVLAVKMNDQMYEVISELGFMDGDPAASSLWPTHMTELDFVKVGRWDFERNKEVDDD